MGLTFVRWYNQEHRHSGLNFLTPNQRHNDLADQILQQRRKVYAEAKAKHPERWSREIRDWSIDDEVWLNPEKTLNTEEEKKQSS
ncbi:hypothetical protein [Anaerosolibacter sp.]|uniref:hypothetical protein n=1 Tax=Anaerosolibacter sp. TaxID=1872527 RepID=UPI0039EF6BCF